MMAIAEDVANGDSAKRDLRIVGNTPYLAVVIAAAPKIAIGRSRTGRPLPRDVSGQKRVREWHDAGRCRIEINARWPFIRLQIIKYCGVPDPIELLNQQRPAKAVLMHIIETLAPAQVACARIQPTQLPRHAEGDSVINNPDLAATFKIPLAEQHTEVAP